MAYPTVDLNFYISPDAGLITVADNTQVWGSDGLDKSNITGTSILIYSVVNSIETLILTLTNQMLSSPTVVSVEIDIEDDIPSLGTYLPDGIYKFVASYTNNITTPLPATGYFFSTRILEQNVNDDLLDLLTGVQAYNSKMDYAGLERLRRRDNIIFAIEAAEYLSQLENVETLIDFAEKLE